MRKHKERYSTNDIFYRSIYERESILNFLLNRNLLDNENDFECNIFEYYYDTTNNDYIHRI